MNRSRIKLFQCLLFMLLFLSVASISAEAQPLAVRQFSSTELEPGEVVTVSIEVSGYGTLGKVTETIPEGFLYTSSTLDDDVAVKVNGRTISFLLIGENRFEYSLLTTDKEGSYTFSGVLTDDNIETYSVSGDSKITVCPPLSSPSDDPNSGDNAGLGKSKSSSSSGFSRLEEDMNPGDSSLPEPTVSQEPDLKGGPLEENETFSKEFSSGTKEKPLHGKRPTAEGTITKEKSSLSKSTSDEVEGSGTPVEETNVKTPGFGFLLSVGVIGILYLYRKKA